MLVVENWKAVELLIRVLTSNFFIFPEKKKKRKCNWHSWLQLWDTLLFFSYRKLLPGFQCHNLETGTRRDSCLITRLISQNLGKIGNKTRETCLGRVLEMKRSSLPKPHPQRQQTLSLLIIITLIIRITTPHQ